MERAISEMEKIRKAEEIYSRRKNPSSISKVNTEKNRNIYKGLFQLLMLFNIAIIIVAVQNRNYIFKNEFIDKVNGYNINVKEKIEDWLKEEPKQNENTKNSSEEQTIPKEAGQTPETNSPEIPKTEEPQSAIVQNEEQKELSQMEMDIQNLKNNYSIILPINGIKTSGFGTRSSNNKIVTSNHTGVDLASRKRNCYKICNVWNSNTSIR